MELIKQFLAANDCDHCEFFVKIMDYYKIL